MGSRNAAGYGLFRGQRAHRLVWEIVNGPIPPGKNVCHRCDNPPCCNPAHLFVGTQGDNIRDAVSKGRLKSPFPNITGDKHWTRRYPERVRRGKDHPWARSGHQQGASNPRAKLTDDGVRDIRRRIAAGEVQKEIAALYDVNPVVISSIKLGQSWTHVE